MSGYIEQVKARNAELAKAGVVKRLVNKVKRKFTDKTPKWKKLRSKALDAVEARDYEKALTLFKQARAAHPDKDSPSAKSLVSHHNDLTLMLARNRDKATLKRTMRRGENLIRR